MKHILYILSVLFVSAAFVGCKQNEIELYDQSPRLNFEWSQRIIEFVDTDYIKKTAFKTDSFEVRIQGVHLNAPRDFCLKVQPAEGYEAAPELELADKYTYSALDTVCQTYRFRVKRPELKWGNKAFGCYVAFDLGNAAHQFDKGLVEKHQMLVNVRWRLRPYDWEEGDWGKYSNGKYIFMMDVLGKAYSNITYDDYETVTKAYEAYVKAGKPDILDDDGNVISF